jgi:hypothetical protein
VAQCTPPAWRGSRYLKESGCRTPYKLEPILDESGNAIDSTLGETNSTFGEAGRLLHHAACDPLHASHWRL